MQQVLGKSRPVRGPGLSDDELDMSSQVWMERDGREARRVSEEDG